MNLLEAKIKLEEKRSLLEAKTEEANEAIEGRDIDKAKELKDEIEAIYVEIDELFKIVDKLEEELAKEEPEEEVEEIKEDGQEEENRNLNLKGDIEMENRKIITEENKEVRAFEEYLETRAITDGVKLEDGYAVIPKEIVEEILELSEDTFKLADLVTKRAVKTGSGTLPVRTTAKATLKTVAELNASPEIAVTPFTEVDYKVQTKRGYIPLSQELVEDGVNVVADIKQYVSEVKVNTDNADIMTVLKGLTNKAVTTADGLKDIVNVDMPVGTQVQFLLSQTVYNEIDKLKDDNGRYLFQDSISAQSGKSLFGRDVIVVNDAEMPTKDTAFIGDFREVVLFERSEMTANWTNYLHYGECLGVAVRNDIKLIEGAKIQKITFKPVAKV